ncbi:DUF2283 domain-containing protein [Candidatus Curtissbacteria bacterium]|nr:DUF2283 domain-containing protein [Candidatus Curtissbacteria bacterium]
MKVKYWKDADLLSIRVSAKLYHDATRSGDLIVHYSKDGKPVLVEILNASKFLKEAGESFSKKLNKSSSGRQYTSVAHRLS